MRLALATAVSLALASGAAQAAVAPELQGAGWAGGGEYTLEQLRGKAVALYFFEAG